jgi:hypothetical protein
MYVTLEPLQMRRLNGWRIAHLSSSSPPVTSSVTMYTLRPVMYTAYSLMQLGWSTWTQQQQQQQHCKCHVLSAGVCAEHCRLRQSAEQQVLCGKGCSFQADVL